MSTRCAYNYNIMLSVCWRLTYVPLSINYSYGKRRNIINVTLHTLLSLQLTVCVFTRCIQALPCSLQWDGHQAYRTGFSRVRPSPGIPRLTGGNKVKRCMEKHNIIFNSSILLTQE